VVSDVDVVLETIGGDNPVRSLKVLKPGGIEVALAAAAPTKEAEAEGKRAVNHSMIPKREQLVELSNLITDLQVRPIIDTVVPFREAIELLKEIQTGHSVGKLVVRVS
jgi:NADPH:quinone reductase-like Zn-dependent oxidoreductase